MRHDTEFFAYPQAGETILVTSRYVDTHRFKGTWLQEVHSLSRSVLLRNYSTGIFINPNTGRPTSANLEMAGNLQRGGSE